MSEKNHLEYLKLSRYEMILNYTQGGGYPFTTANKEFKKEKNSSKLT